MSVRSVPQSKRVRKAKWKNKEFCTYFKDKAQAEQAYNMLDPDHRGYVTREDVRKKRQALDQIIRFTTPAF